MTKRKYISPSGHAVKPAGVVTVEPAPEIEGVDYSGKPPMHYTGCLPAVSELDQANWRRCLVAEREHLAREAEVHAKELAEREATNG
jgi:hypothetical protein